MLAGLIFSSMAWSMQNGPQVKTASGVLEGTVDAATGVRSFKGVPFAQPPVGDLRWKAPEPVRPWSGVRRADAFESRPMQLPIFSDMVFRSPRVDEDCLYLNVWAPAPAPERKKRPVLVYFYGGGFSAGASDEPRYDGESMARKGIVAITVNYRLGLFGFMAHPELTKESPFHASGNYGLLDQSEALRWVRKNVAAFGGDPKRVTIAGESAGSYSVSAQMASPLSKGLIAGAIGESGSLLSGNAPSLADAEKIGSAFGAAVGAPTLADLRALPAQRLLEAARTGYRFGAIVDGHFFPKPPLDIYSAGEQAHVPLLAGWNSEEGGAGSVLGRDPATPEGFATAVRRLYGDRAEEALRVYPHASPDEVRASATELASARFIAYGTWKWIDTHARTGGRPVYRYFYSRPRPGAGGASHSAEIEYALGNLGRNPVYAWTDDDRRVSATMQEYFANFIKAGNPNGAGLPPWPTVGDGSVMHLDVEAGAAPDATRERYRFLDSLRPTGR